MSLVCPTSPLGWLRARTPLFFWPLQQTSDRTAVNESSSVTCSTPLLRMTDTGSLQGLKYRDLWGELGPVLSFNPAEVTDTLLLSPVVSLSRLSEFDIPHVVPCVDFGQLSKTQTDRQTDCLEILSHTHAPLLVLDGVHRNAVNLSKWLCAGCTSMLTDLKYTDGILPQWLLRASTHGARGERANRQFAWFTHSEKKTSLNGSLPNPLLSGPIPPHARYAFTRPAEVLNRSVFSFQLLTFLLPSFPHWLWTCCVKLDTHIFNTLEWAAKPTGQI